VASTGNTGRFTESAAIDRLSTVKKGYLISMAFGVRYMVLGDRCIRGKTGFI
jgi:hypothetical protein